MVSVWLASSNEVRSAASRAFRISIRKRIFGKYCGLLRVEAGRAVLDGIGAVAAAGLRAPSRVTRGSGSGDSPFTG